jgi:hypothetical protein
MDNTKQQLVERIKSASNVLVTVSRNPSVDALSALLGLTLVLNKQGKHAAAVFSGQVPSTIEFLQPEETIEKNTDSLRDFIIALDKNKADKLRYKVEDNVVRIFITPYKTSISQSDFEFSEGDFNIDVVIALGVRQQEDLDEAITAHGRILHDATVASINIVPDAGLGSINWYEPQASSLSELVTELTQLLGDNLLDEQIATALLTGIVSETERFSNDKTSSVTMSMSAALMKSGANQQLVASKLDGQIVVNGADLSDKSNSEDDLSPGTGGPSSGDQSANQDDGAIKIDHNDNSSDASDNTDKLEPEVTPSSLEETPPPSKENKQSDSLPSAVDSSNVVDALPASNNVATTKLSSGPKLMTEPPILGGTLTANSTVPGLDPVTDPLSLPNNDEDQGLERNGPAAIKAPDLAPLSRPEDAAQPTAPILPEQVPVTPTLTPPPTNWTPPPTQPLSTPTQTPNPTMVDVDDEETLAEIEQAVSSTHLATETVDAARDEVKRAYNDSPSLDSNSLPAIDALNAQPLGSALHPNNTTSENSDSPQVIDSNAPPPVPPPIPFQFGNPPSTQ